MKRTILPLVALSMCLIGCFNNSKTINSSVMMPESESESSSQTITQEKDFGVFLGASIKDKDKIKGYKNIAIDVDEFNETTIEEYEKEGTHVYAYLSVGSLETYRDYYDAFKQYTFKEYDNWPDEYWIDVSQVSWIDHLESEAERLKNKGASGLFLDNFDVYYESLDSDKVDSEEIYKACKNIMNRLLKYELNILINSGTDFLERMDSEDSIYCQNILKGITWYAQECVFSSIEDYDNNVFSKQNEEDKEYYQSIIKIMKNNSNILLIEYTNDKELIKEIEDYCKNNNYSYYITNKVNLTV